MFKKIGLFVGAMLASSVSFAQSALVTAATTEIAAVEADAVAVAPLILSVIGVLVVAGVVIGLLRRAGGR